MYTIQQVRFHGKSIKCMVSDGSGLFLTNQVAKILGYAQTSQVDFDHVPKAFTKSYGTLVSDVNKVSLSDIEQHPCIIMTEQQCV